MGTGNFLEAIAEPLRDRVRIALELAPQHRVPRIRLDSNSPWVQIEFIPGPSYCVWMLTGEIFEIDEHDRTVGDDPVEGMGWICEDCHYFTLIEDRALVHSDEHRHSLAVCPLSKAPNLVDA